MFIAAGLQRHIPVALKAKACLCEDYDSLIKNTYLPCCIVSVHFGYLNSHQNQVDVRVIAACFNSLNSGVGKKHFPVDTFEENQAFQLSYLRM